MCPILRSMPPELPPGLCWRAWSIHLSEVRWNVLEPINQNSAKSAPTISCPVRSAKYLREQSRGKGEMTCQSVSRPSLPLSGYSRLGSENRCGSRHISQIVAYVFREGQDKLLFLKSPRQMLPSESNKERIRGCFALFCKP